mmetsp:Transcript_3771/g.11170  ORF Transcript_3771/g.11170 Transcript_3771/m.11170 type:complete len:563 (+) Transcript_3771:3-1691(+)
MRQLIKLRLLLSSDIQSRAVGTIYLIRLYVATFAIFAAVLIFIGGAAYSFPFPYMFQIKHIDADSWQGRFQNLTLKAISLPLLFGVVVDLIGWEMTKLHAEEIEALFQLKRTKENHLLGAQVDTPAKKPHDSESMLNTLLQASGGGGLDYALMQEMERLVLRVHAERDLARASLDDMQARVARQAEERTEANAALKSSRAFLGRGFRDIEMLLEAGFRELEDSRTGFMVQQRKRFKAKLDRERMKRAQAMGQLGSLGGDEDAASFRNSCRADGGSPNPNGRASTARYSLSSVLGMGFGRKPGEGGEGEGGEEEGSDRSSDASSLASDDIERMDFSELQNRLAVNEAKERRSLHAGDGGAAGEAESEAADVRRLEFASLASSKMGKQAQIEELSERLDKESATAETLQLRLEAAVVDEHDVLRVWQRLDGELQEAEVEKATLVAAKQKEKEVGLEKAQLSEGSLEELKEQYRGLRRAEERGLKDLSDAEAQGLEELGRLEADAARLRAQKQGWLDQLAAAEADRQTLFGEAQGVEAAVRDEKARKAEAQSSASHYRNLLNSYM